MDRGALNNTLERGGRHGFGAVDVGFQRRQIVADEIFKILAQFVQIDGTRLHDAGGVRFVNQRQQQMLQRGKFVATGVGQGQRAVNGLLKSRRKRWHFGCSLLFGRSGGQFAQHGPWPW